MMEVDIMQRQRRRRDSRSTEHRAAEAEILKLLSAHLQVPLRGKKRISVGSLKEVEVDGHSREPKIVVEIYAHVGALKSAQTNKIARDFLKFQLIRAKVGFFQDSRCIFVCVCESVRRGIRDCWLAAAANAFDIEIICLQIGNEQKSVLRNAQHRQNHLNLTVPAE